ncbi:MAG: Peroxiredoxin [Polyangiaceae bacterium]|jgi:thiol-disulfide isomerase/thioredoxin|nr:Peroxiredoxin [Polyangiaceae bacterium]
MNKLCSVPRATAAFTVLSLALGCREAGPSAERSRPSAAAAAAASVTAAAEASAAATAPGVSEPATMEAIEPEGPRAQPGLTRTTSEQLLASIRGSGKKATLVNAWASWCGPCRRELPMLQALAANLKPQGVEIVLVSVDEEKDEAKAVSYLKDNHITLRSYLVSGSVADFKQGINPRWPGMLPASFLFDRGARLVHFWGGEAFENELVPVMEAFLAGKPIAAETNYGLAPGKLE